VTLEVSTPAAARPGAIVPLSVGFVCSEYPAFMPQHGGIGSFVHTLARALVDAGHRATVYGFGDHDATSDDAGVRLEMVRRDRPWASLRTMQSRLRRALAAGEIDVAEAAEAEAGCLPGRSATVVRLHGGHHFWCATLPQPRRYSRLLLEQVAIRRAGALCAVSRFAADVTRRAMRLGRRSIEVLSNPVDTDAFSPDPASVVAGSVLFVGAITEKKGVRELCDGMQLVLQHHPDATLSLVGRDIPAPHGGSLRERIEGSLGPALRSRIRFLGPRPRTEVSRLMAAANVCVFPSYMETQGLVLLEAMACGRPVVASCRGPGPEVLGADGDCGFLVDPASPADIADRICRVLGNDDGAARMGQRGRQRAVAEFGVPACLTRNVSFYRRHGHRR